MYSHMEYLQRCFSTTTGWNDDNMFSHILATSNALLHFDVPHGGKLEISSMATAHLASSMTLSNLNSINGLLAYLYLSCPVRNASGTRDILLQEAVSSFRIIEPHALLESARARKRRFRRSSLVYGRMYFPGLALEAMLIKRLSKRLSKDTQLLVKCISNPRLRNNGTMIVYLQENAARFSREYIYLTNEALFGFRCLYNFGKPTRPALGHAQPKFDNSVVLVGAELWYAAMSMSPGLSTAVRYSTRLTLTGKPLTMTVSCNPILGHVSSTYNVKTSVSLTVCSKYDFNWFLYASNLSVGFELYNFKNADKASDTKNGTAHGPHNIHYDTLAPLDDKPLRKTAAGQRLDGHAGHRLDGNLSRRLDGHTSLMDPSGQEVMTAFQNLVKSSDFSSVVKGSMSLSERVVRLVWTGRYKDFLVSAGGTLQMDQQTKAPEIGRWGISLAYAS